MGTFLLDVFKQYNWRKVVVISSNFFLWLDAGKAIRKVQNINVTWSYLSLKANTEFMNYALLSTTAL